MNNISINNELLELAVNQTYYIIDGLYLDDIKREIINTNYTIEDIREKIFPYTDSPFAIYKTDKKDFSITQFKKVDYDDVILSDFSFFSCDTGLLIFININILLEFLEDYNYETLVNSNTDLINIEYWGKITSKFKPEDVGIVVAYNDSGNEFDGSGTYRIS